VTTSTLLGLIEDIVISIVVFLVVSLRNTAGTVFQGANSAAHQIMLKLKITAMRFLPLFKITRVAIKFAKKLSQQM